MPLPGEEIRRRLEEFVARWRDYEGTERGGAQSFLDELLRCYGTDRLEVAQFEDAVAGGIVDMIWPGVCIVEMKRPSEASRLKDHAEQVFRYWQDRSRRTGKGSAYLVLCAFGRFAVFQPGVYWDTPIAEFDLDVVPDQYEALGFLGGLETRFVEDRAELTREAVSLVAQVFQRLEERGGIDPDTRTDLILQTVWCMFAEDLGMFAGRRLFTQILDGLIEDPKRSSADDLGQLFRYLAEPNPRPEHGLYAGTPYADGGLFARPAVVHLELDELELLRQAASYNWKLVEPAIFGSLLEGALGPERVWAIGAHYTAESDIMKVVGPTVIEPWHERIDACTTLAEAQTARRDLASYVVLDPACGSGNFLYVAYRALRRLENELRKRTRQLRRDAGLDDSSRRPIFPITNMKGIELEPFAVQLARVTLWMGHKLAVVELGLDEPVLPLPDLSGIRRGDALKLEWPRADAIVGNPPYHGSQMIRRELGDEYAEWLIEEFGIGLRDYAVYWFRKAHERLEPGGRVGLVATNSVSQGRAREVSLQWIVENGGVITDAVSKQPWPGAAVVNVSIVNWIKEPGEVPARLVLDGAEVNGITPALRAVGADVIDAARLPANRGKSFQGPMPVGHGFILTPDEAQKLLARADASYGEVVRPYLIGDDIANDPGQAPTRYVIDFGVRSLEEAMRYPAAIDILRQRVKKEREKNRDRFRREHWWLLGRPVLSMREALAPLRRYIACNRIGKRILFAWQGRETCPSDLTIVFAFEDDYSIGVLLSHLHHEWARGWSSLRVDIRYTHTTAFETFPWPDPSDAPREKIAELSRGLIACREEICGEREIGLTALTENYAICIASLTRRSRSHTAGRKR
jgi:hypothetical protein